MSAGQHQTLLAENRCPFLMIASAIRPDFNQVHRGRDRSQPFRGEPDRFADGPRRSGHSKTGADARERIVVPTSATIAMIPALERQQAATNAAACELDEELSAPLSEILAEAISALRERSFGARIADAAKAQALTS